MSNNAGRAFRLRERVRRGKQLSPNDARWLAEYSVKHPPTGRRPRATHPEDEWTPPPAPTPEPVRDGEQPPDPTSPATEAGPGAWSGPPPPVAELDPGAVAPASPAEAGQPEPEAEPDPRAVFAAAAAAQVAATINSWNAELAAAGRASIPPVLVDSVFRPACERVVLRFAPASIGGPTTDLIIVAGVGGYTWHARTAMLKATAPEPTTPEPASPSPSRPPTPPPTPAPANATPPTPPTPPTSGPVWSSALFGG